jgi:hypothetical protein
MRYITPLDTYPLCFAQPREMRYITPLDTHPATAPVRQPVARVGLGWQG